MNKHDKKGRKCLFGRAFQFSTVFFPLLSFDSIFFRTRVNFITCDYYAPGQWIGCCYSLSDEMCGTVSQFNIAQIVIWNHMRLLNMMTASGAIINAMHSIRINNFSSSPEIVWFRSQNIGFHNFFHCALHLCARIKCVNVRFRIYLTLIQFFIATFILPQVITAYHLICSSVMRPVSLC